MSTKTASRTAEKPTEEAAPVSGTAVAQARVVPGAVVVSDQEAADYAELRESEGLGYSHKAEDSIVPFLSHLQDLSPEVKKRDPGYIEGAEPGFLLNKATRQLYRIDPETKRLVDAEGRPLVVQPCDFQHCIVQWVPRDLGGGFVARHELQGTVEDTMKRLGAVETVDPRDSKGKKKVWKLGDDELIETRYHFVNVLKPDGGVEPCVLSFKSTGHKTSRDWTAIIKNTRRQVRNPATGEMVTTKPPAWHYKYFVKSPTKSNTQGEWFVLAMEPAGYIEERSIRDEGKALFTAVSSGTLRADEAADGPTGSGPADGEGGVEDRSDLPI